MDNEAYKIEEGYIKRWSWMLLDVLKTNPLVFVIIFLPLYGLSFITNTFALLACGFILGQFSFEIMKISYHKEFTLKNIIQSIKNSLNSMGYAFQSNPILMLFFWGLMFYLSTKTGENKADSITMLKYSFYMSTFYKCSINLYHFKYDLINHGCDNDDVVLDNLLKKAEKLNEKVIFILSNMYVIIFCSWFMPPIISIIFFGFIQLTKYYMFHEMFFGPLTKKQEKKETENNYNLLLEK